MRVIDQQGVQFQCPVTFEDAVTYTPSPSGVYQGVNGGGLVLRWASSAIVSDPGELAGQTAVVYTGYLSPANAMIVGCYVYNKTTAVTSSDGATTGVTLAVGTDADPDGYLQATSLFGAAGLKAGAHGVMVGTGVRLAADGAIKMTLTAVGGGGRDLAHLVGLNAKVAILFVPAVID